MAVKAAAAAFSVAISTALQISGLGGPVAIVIAWTITILLAAYLLAAHFRRKSMRDVQPMAARQRAWTLGHEIVGFIRTRRVAAPRAAGMPRASPRWISRRHAGQVETERAYDEDTIAIFWEKFGDVLLGVVKSLRDQELVGAIEAPTLTTPSTPEEIQRVGRRLVELGSQSRSPQSRLAVQRVDFDAEKIRRRDSPTPAPGRGGSRA